MLSSINFEAFSQNKDIRYVISDRCWTTKNFKFTNKIMKYIFHMYSILLKITFFLFLFRS